MESETVYKRIGVHQVISDRDLVIEIVDGEKMPMAAITDPKASSKSELMPVPQALKVVTEEMALEPYYLEIVIVDEHRLWQEAWGKLIDHPSRADPVSSLSL